MPPKKNAGAPKVDKTFGMSWSSTSQFLLNFIKTLQSVDAKGRQIRTPWKVRQRGKPKPKSVPVPPPAPFASETISSSIRKGTDFKNRAKALLDDIEKQAKRKYKQYRSLEARLNSKGGLEEYLREIIVPAFLTHKMDPSTLFYNKVARKGKPGGVGIVSGKYLERKLCLLNQSQQTRVSASSFHAICAKILCVVSRCRFFFVRRCLC